MSEVEANNWLVPKNINPNHPLYQRQYLAKVRGSLVVLGIGLLMLAGTGIYAGGEEARSIERATKTCASIYCQENVRKMGTIYGETVEDYLAKFPRPSFAEARSDLDQYYSDSDTEPYRILIPSSLVTTLAGLGSLLSFRRADRLRRKEFFKKAA